MPFASATDKPYNPRRSCPKCVYVGITSEHKTWIAGLPVARIERACGRCGYRWNELPVDHVLLLDAVSV